MTGRLILERARPGLWNMGADAWLCRHGKADFHLRLYDWQPWTLSLGFSQTFDPTLEHNCLQENCPVVRRETGGRAVYHADELTYCVTIPKTSPLHTGNLPESYNRINRALRLGLKFFGVDCNQESRRTNMQEHYKKDLGGLCFTASARSEILWDSRKLVGSAQRQLREGLLQHGSLMLGPAHQSIGKFFFNDDEGLLASRRKLVDATTDLQEILGNRPDWDSLCASLQKGFEEEYELTLHHRPFTDEEAAAISELQQQFSPDQPRKSPS